MTVDLKGRPVSFVVNGDRAHTFSVPSDQAHLHPRDNEALVAAESARETERKTKVSDKAARREANDAVRTALESLCDVAAANSKATREHASERYELAVRRYARAVEQAQAAAQEAATAAQVFDKAAHSDGVGISDQSKAHAVRIARIASEHLDALPALPAIDAEAGR
jgi:hypothetical protein